MEIVRNVRARVRTEIVDKTTGVVAKAGDWVENLAFDTALAFLPGGYVTSLFTTLKVGSGVNPNSIAGGAITFTQVGTTITASGAFFTAPMVGGIFKYGTGPAGAEQYIATVAGGGLSCTVTGPGITVSTPAVATVWQVQQTQLQTWLANSASYQTNSGDNSTALVGGTITHQRTFLFATPGSTQNINEIGYSDNSNTDGSCRGRIVLPSTDVVDTSHFYRVVFQFVLTVVPAAPTAVPDVGTNIVTAGNVMFEYYDLSVIQANGTPTSYQPFGSTPLFMDGGNSGGYFGFRTATWTQPSAIQTGDAPGVAAASNYAFFLNTFSTSGQPLGVTRSHTTFSFTTAGETVAGFAVGCKDGGNMHLVWSLKLTTPVTLPTGTFQGNLDITKVFTRTLTN